MINTTFLKHPWVKTSFYLLQFLLLMWFTYIVISRRPPHFADEGYYFYEAWVHYRAPQSIPLASRLLVNFGYILGWPYLFMREPGILFFRAYSLILWFGGWALFFYGYLRHWGPKWLFFLLLGLTPFGLVYMTINYNTMPVLFTAAAGGLFLWATTEKKPLWLSISGFLTACCMGLSVLAYTPSIAAAFIIAISALFCLKNRYYTQGLLFGALIGVIGISLLTPISPLSLYHFISSNYGHGKHFYTNIYGSSGDLLIRTLFNFIALLIFVIKPLLIGYFLVVCGIILFDQGGFLAKYSIKTRYIILGVFLFLAIFLLFTTPQLQLRPLSSIWSLYYHDAATGLSWVGIFLIPFIVYFFNKYPQEIRWPLALPLIWLFLVYLTENTFGRSPSQYYFSFVAPAFLGVTWIIFNNQIVSKPRLFKVCLHSFFMLIVIFSLHFFRTVGLEDVGLKTTPLHIEGAKFNGLSLSPLYVNYIENIEQAYHQAHCEKRFFASIESIALPYYMFNRVSPFGTSWTEIPTKQQWDLLKQQKEICLIYRGKKSQDGLALVNPKASNRVITYYQLLDSPPINIYMLAR